MPPSRPKPLIWAFLKAAPEVVAGAEDAALDAALADGPAVEDAPARETVPVGFVVASIVHCRSLGSV